MRDPFSHVMFVWQITHRSLLEEDKSDLNPWPFPPGNHGANPLRKDDRLSAPTHMQSGARGQSIVIDFWRWVGGRRRENSEGKKSKNLLFPKILPSCVRDVSGGKFRNLSLLTCLSLISFSPDDFSLSLFILEKELNANWWMSFRHLFPLSLFGRGAKTTRAKPTADIDRW